MKPKITQDKITELIKRYKLGETAKKLYTEAGIGKTTFYSYVKSYNESTSSNSNATKLHLSNLQLHKLQQIVEIKDRVNCNVLSSTRDKLNELEKLHGQYSVHALCDALKVDRGTYYNHIKRNKRDDAWYIKHREELKTLVQDVYNEYDQIFGATKISYILKERGFASSPEYVRSIMKELGLKSISVNAKQDYTLLIKKNRVDKLKRIFTATAPNVIWVSDTSSFKIQNTWYYICVIIDLYSRKVISYKISTRHTSNLISGTFKLAMADRDIDNLTFHSDQGAQYTSKVFMKMLNSLNVTQSFSPTGSPYHNAVAESFFSYLKKEEIYRRDYRSSAEFRTRVSRYISFYNDERPHSYLRYQVPTAYEKKYFDNMNSSVRI